MRVQDSPQNGSILADGPTAVIGSGVFQPWITT